MNGDRLHGRGVGRRWVEVLARPPHDFATPVTRSMVAPTGLPIPPWPTRGVGRLRDKSEGVKLTIFSSSDSAPEKSGASGPRTSDCPNTRGLEAPSGSPP